MSFLKSLLLAIVATVFLTYVLGTSFVELLDVDIYMHDKLIEPIQAISVSALVIVLLVVAALAIILSVFGTIIFIVLLGVGAAVMFMVGVFWPILLVAFVVWLMARDNKGDREVHS
ncbi:hypothetical protein [Pseudocolwellia agarivorans]|uniref:hypothetical protein n=1 Tax=Pseudocolwellia agarivorans TaxID=1911682 RepID=UPI0009862751|nr:hypothetical protein [Pseudocolwellia agarivorans]